MADFVTGSSIREGEQAIGVVIVPQKRGWPNPVLSAATDPVHAHDRFSPLSFPLHGSVNDVGFFEPHHDQLSLRLLLETTGFANWTAFFEKACDFRGDAPGFGLDGERTVAGVSVMKAETFDCLVRMGRPGHNPSNDPVNAARILVDAQLRFDKTGELDVLHVAMLNGSPKPGSIWTTLSGDEIVVPTCSIGLSQGYPWELNYIAASHVTHSYQTASRMPLDDVASLYACFSEFHGLSRGLSLVGKYFAPAGFIRHDNYAAIRDLNITSLTALIRGVSERSRYGIESRQEAFFDDMEALSDRLDALKGLVDEEVSKARAEFGSWHGIATVRSSTPAPKQ
ncbi:hypothetical protein HFO56_23835 [Rhizobium laguerreae]|uniref:hypothetical protein n=1 Tax=Rhizobium laguerreae TaxID=1076926 RepID=UPI001C90702F|nr:hypothetical protein [Rhizobium laguerreae]MBY3155359.1 hypothetical protein [Rhizobium laguerreae]